MAFGDTYVIERDERDKGGKLITLCEFEDCKLALAAWEKVATPCDDETQMWLLCRQGGSLDPYQAIVMDVKCK